MKLTVNDLFELINFRHHKVQDTTIIVGGVAANKGDRITEAGDYGSWLATHYVGELPWIDIIQIIGAIGVLVGIANILVRAVYIIFFRK